MTTTTTPGTREEDAKLAELLGREVYRDWPCDVWDGRLSPWGTWDRDHRPHAEADGCEALWMTEPDRYLEPVPRYGSDLNAMHAVETRLAELGLTDEYAWAVKAEPMEEHEWNCSEMFGLLHAPAPVRRAAAIRVLEENKK